MKCQHTSHGDTTQTECGHGIPTDPDATHCSRCGREIVEAKQGPTPGPWKATACGGAWWIEATHPTEGVDNLACLKNCDNAEANARHIVALHNKLRPAADEFVDSANLFGVTDVPIRLFHELREAVNEIRGKG